jgi:hypothetical protein
MKALSIPEEAIRLEKRYLGQRGEPTLGEVYLILRDCWREGDRDRELGLHLMFVAWYGCAEPPFLTGINVASNELNSIFAEVHDYFGSSIQNDAEMLYVVGLMVHLFPYCLGNEDEWIQISRSYRERYRKLSPTGIDPSVFSNRGAFGEYFQHQAKSETGF